MKKLVAILLTALMASASVVSVSAFSPLEPNEQVKYNFKKFYSQKSDNQVPISISCLEIENCFSGNLQKDCYLVVFTSENSDKEPYFSTFGKNNEYYEYSSVTNSVYKSGLAVFLGNVYDENCKESFYSLEEIAEINPKVIDSISEIFGTEYVGKMGDADCDGKLTVNDVTKMQNILTDSVLLEGLPYIALDVNFDGKVSVADITVLQNNIARV